MLDDRAAIYNLVQTFGGRGTLYTLAETVTSKTGVIASAVVPYRLKHLVRMPDKRIYVVTPVTQVGQKPFSYSKTLVRFLVSQVELPKGFEPQQSNYIVYAKVGYQVESTEYSEYRGAFYCDCTKMSGDIPKQVYDMRLRDDIDFTETLEQA